MVIEMPAVVPRNIKDSVIEGWLCGLSRRQNAIRNRVAEGSVDNFVKEWNCSMAQMANTSVSERWGLLCQRTASQFYSALTDIGVL